MARATATVAVAVVAVAVAARFDGNRSWPKDVRVRVVTVSLQRQSLGGWRQTDWPATAAPTKSHRRMRVRHTLRRRRRRRRHPPAVGRTTLRGARVQGERNARATGGHSSLSAVQ